MVHSVLVATVCHHSRIMSMNLTKIDLSIEHVDYISLSESKLSQERYMCNINYLYLFEWGFPDASQVNLSPESEDKSVNMLC